ncbi:MAG: ABC transporter ATP-binding protein [Aliarcobacter sp.]|jgi:teichoic acid transport system ATP-binding protein|nr:ABC transporter ATP-binding protein [Aliarcobacter sp.]
MNNTAIKVNNLTKIYKLYDKPQDRLKEALHPFKKKYHKDFHALNDVSFEIKKGETVGIIGKNGAGKSTLLKIITGVLTPTSGNVHVNGRIASLLELGAGFNPEYTGVENIYLQGTLMGLSHEEMKTKVDEILAFADIGDFIHQPVKMYSSGMYARLAFAVAINVDPDILIVDEALSVGDVAFQSKCFRKFIDFQKRDKTILFVTHSIDDIIRHCNRGILIDDGLKIYQGNTKQATELYKTMMFGINIEDANQNKVSNIDSNKLEINKEHYSFGNNKATIIKCGIFDENNKATLFLDYEKEYLFKYTVRFNSKVDVPVLGMTIRDKGGLELAGTNTFFYRIDLGEKSQDDIIDISFKVRIPFRADEYFVSFNVTAWGENGSEALHRLHDFFIIKIMNPKSLLGFVELHADITIG